MTPHTASESFRFGEFELDLQTAELRHNGQTTILQEQAFHILAALLERPGRVVTRDELRKRVWSSHTFVDFDQGLNKAVNRLRDVLGDSAEHPRFIETLPRRGYRFIAPVQRMENSTPSASANLLGKKVSHYRVLEILGGGGMGLVYKAEDLKLGRRVALKFLPEELSKDPKALERFEREARAASALDHPNICSVYEFGEHEGQPFLVMPLLEGQTLRDRIALLPSAPFTTDDLLTLGIQIADGLQAAHEKGIIHRDIKPANIFVTNRGEAKILDFGLAKLALAEDNQSLPHQETRTGQADLTLTHTGVALGTAAYMSPEQVRGEKLDARTDLFSFGLVLYEMAAGQRAFTGETAPMLHAAVLNQIPTPVRQLNPEITPELETIINKSLEKDRQERYQTASEMRACFRAAAATRGGKTSLANHPEPAPHTRWLVVVTGVLALLLVISTVWFAKRQSSGLPQLKQTQLTNNSFELSGGVGSISPDGKYLAYIDAKGMQLKLIDGGETRTLPPPDALKGRQGDCGFGGWFPDSTRFLVNRCPSGVRAEELSSHGTSIWIFSVLGTVPRRLRDDALGNGISPDGSAIAFTTNPGRFGDREIWLMGPDGANARRLYDTNQNSAIGGVAWSPDGKLIAYSRIDSEGASLLSRDLKGGPPTTIFAPSVGNQVFEYLWLRGRLIYSMAEPQALGGSGCNFWEMRLDGDTGKPIEEPRRLTSWSGFCMSGESATADGKKLAFLRWASHFTIYMADLDASGTRVISSKHFTLNESRDFPGAWTPDGKALIFVSDRGGRFGVYKQFQGEDAAQPLATPEEGARDPVVTPDGRWVLYFVHRDNPVGTRNESKPEPLMRVRIGGGPSQLVLTAVPESQVSCARPTSDLCVIAELSEDRKQVIVNAVDPVTGRGSELTRFAVHPDDDRWNVELSPDATRFAAIRSPDDPIYVWSLHGKKMREVRVIGWSNLRNLSWAGDGKGLLVVTRQKGYGTVLHVDFQGHANVLWERATEGVAESPDGHHLCISSNTVDQNVWMLENF